MDQLEVLELVVVVVVVAEAQVLELQQHVEQAVKVVAEEL
jgi:hypothetical protein